MPCRLPVLAARRLSSPSQAPAQCLLSPSRAQALRRRSQAATAAGDSRQSRCRRAASSDLRSTPPTSWRDSVHVVVVGCGRVGSELAGTLEKSGHTVAVIDKNPNAFRRLPAGYAGQRIVGFGFDRDNLEEAGIERAGALAAVTNGDNSNILVARIARESFGIERVVARIYDPRRAVIYQRLGIPTVATVSWTTDQVLRRLLPAEQPHDWIDPSARVSLVERVLPAVTRLGTAQIAGAKLVGQEGDVLHFVVDVTAMDALRERLEHGPEA